MALWAMCEKKGHLILLFYPALPYLVILWTSCNKSALVPYIRHACLMALFHCMVRYGSARLGTVRYGSVRVGLHFHRSLVPL